MSNASRVRPYSRGRALALRANPYIAAGCVLDRRQCVAADAARRHLLGVDRAEPFAPVRPPRALVLFGALDPVGKRHVLDVVVEPVLVLAGGGRIDDAGDVPG